MPSTDLMEAKLESVEARTDTKIARIEGKLDVVIAKLDAANAGSASLKANLWAVCAVIVATVALTAGVALTVAPAAFGFGVQLRDAVQKEVQALSPGRSGAATGQPSSQ